MPNPSSIIGFQTSGGSIYLYDEYGRTRRFKATDGVGQGEWHPLSHCIFVPNVTHPRRVYDHETARIDLCYSTESDGVTYVLPYDSDTGAPLPRPPLPLLMHIRVQDRTTKRRILSIEGFVDPAIGLVPVEKTRDVPRGISLTHVGHPITKVFTSLHDIVDASIKLGKNLSK